MTISTDPITTFQLMHDDAFRNAFQAIARKALPYMDPDAYHSDLLHDAARASRLEADERFYLLVRGLGTNIYAYPDDAVERSTQTDGRAVLRVTRRPYDSFEVALIHEC